MSIQLIVDTGCDLPKHIIDEYNIEVLPLVVHVNDNEFYDKETIQPSTLYTEMKNGAVPKTSQVPPDRMKQLFQKLAENNQPAIYITLSSELSGTYQTACLMKEQVIEEGFNPELQIVDSKSASLGYGLIAYYLATKMAESELDLQRATSITHSLINKIEHIFTVDDLEYLVRGGRVSKAAGFVGGLLKIKPVLHMEEGKLFPIEKVRGRKKVLSRLIELINERGQNFDQQTIAISHADDLTRANELKEMIESEFKVKNVMVNTIGCAIGAHSGPGTLAVYFLNGSPDSE
ncbi:DegV family protein [Pseudalkalibacillus berkeleyi]|uniref:DegV family protein n=1 Tax=Pseudalkalibacillus berkeleyi TaxID=1069813 RepID=A0ABS9GVF2_9BACL|nr:DegV family protein [Pseudalkalibacillus berkeleyi]MCF6136802.1 DegV family protein [Pseudalkalibacillus berkeleyi]